MQSSTGARSSPCNFFARSSSAIINSEAQSKMATQLASATDQLWDRWPYLSHEQRLKQFRELHTGEKADFFLALNAHDQYNLLLGLPEDQRHVWMRLLAPDDAADVIQQAGPEEREELLALLDDPPRKA